MSIRSPFAQEKGPVSPPENRPRSPQDRPRGESGRYRTPVLTARQRWYTPARRVVELAAIVCLAAAAVPVVLLAALLVKLTSRGPAFYTQTRIGRGGRPFTIYKIRTMIHNCESLTGPRWSMPGDPRITWVGQFLRASHLDELPQLLNVLYGDMSLVGPRPERPEFVGELERAVPGYRDRLLVRPGVTGLAQVQLEPDTGLDSVRHKLTYDLFYIHHLGPWLDLGILAATGLHVLGLSFARIQRLFRFPSRDAVEVAVRLDPAGQEVPRVRKAA